MASLLQDFASENCPVVEQFLKAGAIPLVKGSGTQGSLTLAGGNPIFGPVINFLDHGRSTGGSCAGDASLVGAKCVALSIGLDFDGGLLTSAAFMGTYAFRPSQSRILH